MATRIRLMTHNIWGNDKNTPEWEALGADCSAQARVGGLLQVYRDTLPDIVGCQEATALMVDLLKSAFETEDVKYTLIWGRFTPIMYRADKFELVDSAFGTYPDEIEGYEGVFNNNRTKAWNLGVFRQKENGKLFIFATTHLWWKHEPEKDTDTGPSFQLHSNKAKAYQLNQMLDKVEQYRKQYDCPAVVTGDMNADYPSMAIQHALARGYRHAHNIATEYAEENIGYHYCYPWGFRMKYSDLPFEESVDHILVIGEKEGAVKRFERYSPEYYPTIPDHSPAYIDREW